MATDQSTIDYITEQTARAGEISSRKMFGEYALYCDDKVVGFICDDQFFLKPTAGIEEALKEVTMGHPYPGSKEYFLISEEYWDDADYMAKLVRTTADALPLPKPKKR